MSAVAIAGVPANATVTPGIGSTLGFTIINDASGGTSGTTVSHANSGGASGTAFDTVNQGTGGSIKYINTPIHGSPLGIQFITPASITSFIIWSTVITGLTGPTNRIRTRQYVSVPSIGQKFQIVKVLGPASAFEGAIYIDATGHILVEDSGFNIKATSTNTITANSYFRIEVDWFFNATTGHINCELFLSPDSKTATETLNSGNINTSTAWSQVNFGDSNGGAGSQTVTMTGFAASNKGGKIGPMAWSKTPISGVGIQGVATVTAGIGSVKVGTGVHVHGVAATATATGTVGTHKNGFHIPGVAASATGQGNPGTVSVGDAAIVHGVAGTSTAAGGIGSVHAGRSVHVVGTAAVITVQAGIGSQPGVVRIHGVAALASAAGGIGHLSIGRRIAGVAATGTANGTIGFPNVPNVAATVTGVAAVVVATGTPVKPLAVARVFGRAAPANVSGGAGAPRLTSGNPNPTIIFDAVKKVLGFFPEYTAFDADIIVAINAAISNLRRLGVGPTNAFRVTDRSKLWTDLWPHTASLGMIQSYIYLSTRLAFDLPGTSFNIAVLEQQVAELEWRIVLMAETLNPPSNPFAMA